jgi:5-methylcytosine-specific restriction endonuclease McrA
MHTGAFIRGSKCEECGFVPVHRCQLTIDHIDGNHKNNARNNLKTLCHNCHHLKSYLAKDYVRKAEKASNIKQEQYELEIDK